MRKIITVLMVLMLSLSVVACDNEKAESQPKSGVGNTFTGEGGSTPDTSSAPSKNESKPSNNSSQNDDSSAPSSSTPTTTASKLTVYETVKEYSIYYCADDYNVFETSFYTDYWKMPFAKEDDGSITRDGYVLLGYSYNENGKGELIRPGYKYILPSKDSYQYLYCVWAKETNPSDFKTIERNGSLYINSYKGKDKVVYIPRTINGKTVTGITSNAFKNNSTMTEVHITSSILEIEANAFASCSKLNTVTLYDNLQSVSDASFKGSPIKKVRICAAKKPSYANSYGVGIKYERLIKTKGKKRIIVVAGSSALYGIETEYMESLFKNDYKVVNFGTNANMNILFYLDAITPLLTKNDAVIFSPEQYGPYAYHTNGNPEMPNATFQGLASCYNLFENIDVSKYTKVFDAFGQYCTQASRMRPLSWEDHDENINAIGDHAKITNKMNSPDFRYGANGYFRFDNTVIPSEYIKNLNRVIARAKGTNAKVLFSYPPHNKNNIEEDSKNDEAYDFYNNWISKTVKCTLISDIRNYLYTAEYFANTDYHLNTVGRKLHTKQLANDIIKAKVGIK